MKTGSGVWVPALAALMTSSRFIIGMSAVCQVSAWSGASAKMETPTMPRLEMIKIDCASLVVRDRLHRKRRVQEERRMSSSEHVAIKPTAVGDID